MFQSTSTGVFGLMAMPAFNPCEWMYLISFVGLVFSSDVASGDSAAVDDIAASKWKQYRSQPAFLKSATHLCGYIQG